MFDPAALYTVAQIAAFLGHDREERHRIRIRAQRALINREATGSVGSPPVPAYSGAVWNSLIPKLKPMPEEGSGRGQKLRFRRVRGDGFGNWGH